MSQIQFGTIVCTIPGNVPISFQLQRGCKERERSFFNGLNLPIRTRACLRLLSYEIFRRGRGGVSTRAFTQGLNWAFIIMIMGASLSALIVDQSGAALSPSAPLQFNQLYYLKLLQFPAQTVERKLLTYDVVPKITRRVI